MGTSLVIASKKSGILYLHGSAVKVIDSGTHLAAHHMQIDAQLLSYPLDEPVLRFYDWLGAAITYGYFISPLEWLKKLPDNAARRPTGGGLIFHEHDFSFTLALPLSHPLTQKPVLERYQLINNQVLAAIQQVVPECDLSLQLLQPKETIDELCMANPTVYDLLLAGKKVGGSAQRKNKYAFIHQCSLFLATPDWDRIAQELVDPARILPKLKAFTGSVFTNQKNIPAYFRACLKVALEDALANEVKKGKY